MKRFTMLLAVLGAAALAACGEDAATNPLAPTEHAAELERTGARIAVNACAQCHGGNLLGAVTEAGVAPSLIVVRFYTEDQIEMLLTTGVNREGRPVVPTDVIAKLTLGDRWELRDYLLRLREPD